MTTKILYFISVISFLFFLFINIESPIKIQGDGVFYYSWAHSCFFDGDIDFKNEIKHFSDYDFYSKKFIDENIVTKTGMIPNPYAFGTAIIWMPFVAIAHWVSITFFYFTENRLFFPDGYSYFYTLFVNLATWAFGTTSFFLIFKNLKYYFSNKISLVTTISLWLGTPWFYYQFLEPSMSHLASLFCMSAFFILVCRILEKQKISFVYFFLLVFLAVAVRWQNIISIFVFWGVYNLDKERKEAENKISTLVIAATASVLFLQAIAWKIIYGSLLLIPQGSDFLFSDFYGITTLFSSNRGLFFWSPILLLSLAGIFLWKKNKLVSVLIGFSFLGQWIVNSILSDPGGGDAFGARRFIEIIPFLAIPLAEAIKYFWNRKIIILVAGLVSWSLFLLVGYHYDIIPRFGNFNLFEVLRYI